MGEKRIIVCDVCGAPAVKEGRVSIKTAGIKGLSKDLCALHLKELLTGAYQAKVGRRSGEFVETMNPSLLSKLNEPVVTNGDQPKKRGRPRKVATAEAATAPKRRGRPPKSATKKAPSRIAKRRGRPPKVKSETEEVKEPVAVAS